MASLSDAISRSFMSLYKNLANIQDLDRDNLIELVKIVVSRHKSAVKAFSSITKNDADKFRERLSLVLPSSKVREVVFWQEFLKGLQTKASQIEHAKLFDSIVKSRNAHVTMLEDILKHFEELFPTEMISFSELTQVQLLIFSAIKQSYMFANWSDYMWEMLTSLVDGSENDIPKYRLKFITDNTTAVITIVNSAVLNENSLAGEALTKLKSSGKDSKLIQNGMVSNNLLPVTTIISIISALAGAVTIITILYIGGKWLVALFQMVQNKFDMYVHEEYLKNKELKEWAEARVAKLRMDLQNMNPNDPQYQKLTKIVEAYDEKIRDLDEKINSYLGE